MTSNLILLAFKSSWRPRKECCMALKRVWRLSNTVSKEGPEIYRMVSSVYRWIRESPAARATSLMYIECIQRQYVKLASQLQTTCNHARPGLPHPASSSVGSSEEGVFLSVFCFCGEKLILIGWAWLPSGCTSALSCEIHRLGPHECISID